ncbi:MAG: OsmC family peroxiredoxin [Lentimicrobium sp.]|nr:OsmC family peroxiredoxin [Lentimicrobium sp.]
MNRETDKSKELIASIRLLNNKLHFEGKVDGNELISIDYTPPLGDNLGYTSLELLLLSLSSCLGSAILAFLRKMQKTIVACEISAKGIRREEHPTCFKTISLFINLSSPDTTSEELTKVLKLSEETYCPVWAMLKGNVEIIVNYSINS